VTRPVVVPDGETRRRVRQMAERQLSREEFDAYVNAPMSDDERTEIRSLIAWFCKRYPTPLERLRAARRFYRRAQTRMPPAPPTE